MEKETKNCRISVSIVDHTLTASKHLWQIFSCALNVFHSSSSSCSHVYNVSHIFSIFFFRLSILLASCDFRMRLAFSIFLLWKSKSVAWCTLAALIFGAITVISCWIRKCRYFQHFHTICSIHFGSYYFEGIIGKA